MSNTNVDNLSLFYVCPSCGALTVEGHDDDMQINCGACSHSFLMKLAEQVTVSDDVIARDYERRKNSATWTAYVKRPS